MENQKSFFSGDMANIVSFSGDFQKVMKRTRFLPAASKQSKTNKIPTVFSILFSGEVSCLFNWAIVINESRALLPLHFIPVKRCAKSYGFNYTNRVVERGKTGLTFV